MYKRQLPDIDGNEIIRSIRSWTSIPILVISARTTEDDKAGALDLGADDYLTKPFSTVELLARIRTALRHARTPAAVSYTHLDVYKRQRWWSRSSWRAPRSESAENIVIKRENIRCV